MDLEPAAIALRRAARANVPRDVPAGSRKKFYEFSVTLSCNGEHVNPQKMGEFVEWMKTTDHVRTAYAALEVGGAEGHRHVQAFIEAFTTNTRAIKAQCKTDLPWLREQGWSLCFRALNNQGLHTRHGIVGYCRKEKNQLHFEQLVCRNLTEQDLIRADREYVLYGSPDRFKKRITLKPTNILPRAEMYLLTSGRPHDRHRPTLHGVVTSMLHTGNYKLGMEWGMANHGTAHQTRINLCLKSHIDPCGMSLAEVQHVLYGYGGLGRYFDPSRSPSPVRAPQPGYVSVHNDVWYEAAQAGQGPSSSRAPPAAPAVTHTLTALEERVMLAALADKLVSAAWGAFMPAADA